MDRDHEVLDDVNEAATPDPGARPDVPEPWPMDTDHRAARSELSRLLTGLHYPATREAAVQKAQANGAGEITIRRLSRLPDGTFDLFQAIWEALGGQPD